MKTGCPGTAQSPSFKYFAMASTDTWIRKARRQVNGKAVRNDDLTTPSVLSILSKISNHNHSSQTSAISDTWFQPFPFHTQNRMLLACIAW